VVLCDVAALALASVLPSGAASRVLILAAIVNPVDAARTGALMGIEGTAAFGAASLALLRFTGGPWRTAFFLGLSVVAWTVAPTVVAIRRLRRADV
jgi:Cu-processing system permease protein